MLFVILKDFCTFDTNISTTLHNSLLSIVNRYIILHRNAFFEYIKQINLNLQYFYECYFRNMEFLTSRAATKINCLALISLLNYFDEETIGKYFVDILKNIIKFENSRAR